MRPPRYYPQHWRSSRPYGKTLATAGRVSAQAGGVQAATEALLKLISRAAIDAGRPLERLMENEFLSRELMVSQTVAQTELLGGLVLDFAPSLVEALRHSDTGEMRLADVVEPAPAYYVHFGAQPDWLLNGHWPLEGVLVIHLHANYRFLLVGRSREQSWLHPLAHEHYMLRMPEADCGQLPFDAAIDAAIRIDIEDIEAARQSRALQGRDNGLHSVASRAFEAATAIHAVNREVMVKALRLMGNALAYASVYPQDAREAWQPDTPESMVAKAGRPGKEGKNTESRLLSMGFRRARRIGEGFEVAVESALEAAARGHAGGSGGAKSPHWRTGHWRNQPHGPNMALRKLIWIRPMRILGGG